MVTDCFTASNTFKCSLHKNAGSGKAAGYVIAPSRVSFSVLPVAALSGAVRYLRRSVPAAAVSLPLGAACAAETVRHTLFLTVRVDIKYFMLDGYLCLFIFFAGEISKDMLQQEKITKRIEWKLANGIKISSIVKENLLSLWIGTLILLFPLLLIISIRLPNLILLLGTYFLILSILYSAFINVLILWIRNMNWFKSIPIFATLLHILLVVLKCGIFMKTNNVWVLLLFSPVSIIVLTACGLCLMTKERIVSSYY